MTFLRHYLEMVLAMLLGMGVVMGALGAADVELDVDPQQLVMATTKTLPKVAWMRYRGHGWAP
jgi:hypothetical protein